jgi:hypothetical protein
MDMDLNATYSMQAQYIGNSDFELDNDRPTPIKESGVSSTKNCIDLERPMPCLIVYLWNPGVFDLIY